MYFNRVWSVASRSDRWWAGCGRNVDDDQHQLLVRVWLPLKLGIGVDNGDVSRCDECIGALARSDASGTRGQIREYAYGTVCDSIEKAAIQRLGVRMINA